MEVQNFFYDSTFVEGGIIHVLNDFLRLVLSLLIRT